jgi:hypothetical protein
MRMSWNFVWPREVVSHVQRHAVPDILHYITAMVSGSNDTSDSSVYLKNSKHHLLTAICFSHSSTLSEIPSPKRAVRQTWWSGLIANLIDEWREALSGYRLQELSRPRDRRLE